VLRYIRNKILEENLSFVRKISGQAAKKNANCLFVGENNVKNFG